MRSSRGPNSCSQQPVVVGAVHLAAPVQPKQRIEIHAVENVVERYRVECIEDPRTAAAESERRRDRRRAPRPGRILLRPTSAGALQLMLGGLARFSRRNISFCVELVKRSTIARPSNASLA